MSDSSIFSWPTKMPDLGVSVSGWVDRYKQKVIKEIIDSTSPDPKTICELGSWLGQSTLFFLESFPNCHVYAIDHWSDQIRDYGNGSFLNLSDDEIEKIKKTARSRGKSGPLLDSFIRTLYEQFLRNCWNHQARLTPIREYTLPGLDILEEKKVTPDVVFVDASHGYDDVLADIRRCHTLWPSALIVGDDYSWDSVARAVKAFCKESGLNHRSHERGIWSIYKQGE